MFVISDGELSVSLFAAGVESGSVPRVSFRNLLFLLCTVTFELS